jgi:hypothetical protein
LEFASHRNARHSNRIIPAQFSIANAQQVLPLPEAAFEAHAFGNLKRRDEASLDLLAAFARWFAS